MADSIEAAITSSISSLPGSDSSSGGGDTSATAVADAPATDTTDASASTTAPTDTAAAPAAPVVPGAAATTPPTADTVAPEAATPAEETLDTLRAELAGKRDNRIPYSRVTKIVENAEKKAEQRVRAEVESEVAEYRTPEFQNGVTAMRVADQNPEQFLAALAQADPRYAALLEGAKVLGAVQPAGKARPAAAVEVPEGDVEADIQLSDGTLGFSAEATKRREAKLRAELRDEMTAAFNERLKGLEPIEQEHRVATLRKEAAGRVEGQIAAASNWPGFNENREGIARRITDATKKGQKLSLHDAYIQEVIPKFRTDEAAVRARIVAEMNDTAAAATRVTPSAARPAAAAEVASDMDPVEAAIRASIKG